MSNPQRAAELLREAKAKIADPKCWTRGEYARDDNGESVSPTSNQAVCWCIDGALRTVDQYGLFLSIHGYLSDALNTVDGVDTRIKFNDDPRTTHEDVMALFDRAIQLAEQDAS